MRSIFKYKTTRAQMQALSNGNYYRRAGSSCAVGETTTVELLCPVEYVTNARFRPPLDPQSWTLFDFCATEELSKAKTNHFIIRRVLSSMFFKRVLKPVERWKTSRNHGLLLSVCSAFLCATLNKTLNKRKLLDYCAIKITQGRFFICVLAISAMDKCRNFY